MYDLGIVVGKFAPLTRGHIMLINQAAVSAKKVLVVLSHDQRWVDNQSERDRKVLAVNNRKRWLNQTFSQDPHIDIAVLDETDIPEYPNGWPEYASLLKTLVAKHLVKMTAQDASLTASGSRVAPTVAIFSSEIDYDARYAQYLPFVSHVVVDADRSSVPISATKVRNNLFDNWSFLPSVVRRDYARRVVFLGTESVGKTTLVRALAKYFNTSWVEEYGRTFCETTLVGDESTLRSSDYPLIAYRQKELEEQALLTANKLCLVDTNAFITEFYHRLYEKTPNSIVTAIAQNEQYDLTIILSDEVPWVADGLRSNDDRTVSRLLFENMLAEFPGQTSGNVVYITGDSYKSRYDQALRSIEQFMHNYNGTPT